MKWLVNLLFVIPFFGFSQNDLQKAFKEYKLKGSTTIYDYKNRKWYYTDKEDAYRETSPASTFKIVNSLIALDTKAAMDTTEVFKWDGQEKTFKGTTIAEWNMDTDMKTAFRNSTIWVYVRLAKKIGLKSNKYYLRKIQYGNLKIEGGKDGDFWNYGAFGISPYNQINFLKKLYEGELPFSDSTINKVKDMMLSETTGNYTIYSKSGWSYDKFDNGWWVGYIKTVDNVYFFATRVTKDWVVLNENFSESRKAITKEIFNMLNLLQLK